MSNVDLMAHAVRPILEELAREEGTQKEVYTRMGKAMNDLHYRYKGFKRLWRMLIVQGSIEAVKPGLFAYKQRSHKLTVYGQEQLGND